MVIQIVRETTKAAVQAIMVERGDEDIRHKSVEAGMRSKLGGPSPIFNFTKEVKNVCQTYNSDQAEKIPILKKLTR